MLGGTNTINLVITKLDISEFTMIKDFEKGLEYIGEKVAFETEMMMKVKNAMNLANERDCSFQRFVN